jgi:hypothetical protein
LMGNSGWRMKAKRGGLDSSPSPTDGMAIFDAFSYVSDVCRQYSSFSWSIIEKAVTGSKTSISRDGICDGSQEIDGHRRMPASVDAPEMEFFAWIPSG